MRSRCVLRRSPRLMARFQDNAMCTKSDASGRLRVTQAYIALLGIAGSSFPPKMVSVTRIDDAVSAFDELVAQI